MSKRPNTPAPGEDTLEQAIRTLLRSVPETWAEYDPAVLTELRERGLFLLTAAGMVERRSSFRLRMFGHPVAVEATCTVTGEYGGVEALERVAAGVWEQWGQAWQARKEGPTKDAPAFHCERMGREQWRLTADGIQARKDLETEAAVVFDFVLRRGFFDGRPRQMPDGRISQRLPVRGKGALEKMELVKADAPRAGPEGVNIANWPDGAKAFADAFAGLSAAMQTKAATPAPPAPKSAGEHQAEWLAKAMLMVRDHPDWSDAEIARRVGKSPGTLSRSKEYQMAAKLARGSKTDRPTGYVTVDPDSGAADVEAVAPKAAPADDRSDRGKPIPGSRYFREYCAECREPMGVTQDKVGKKPVCDDCAE